MYMAGYVILGYNKTLQIKRIIRPWRRDFVQLDWFLSGIKLIHKKCQSNMYDNFQWSIYIHIPFYAFDQSEIEQ